MSYDIYAEYPCNDEKQVDGIVRDSKLNTPTKIKLLAQALSTNAKDYARVGKRGQSAGYKNLLSGKNLTHRDLMNRIIGLPAAPRFELLPPQTTFIQFSFTLSQPYISRDDELFHINENPVRKDKIFKVPMVSAMSWKGNLRWTAMKTDLEPVRDNPEELIERRLRHIKLFGSEKGFDTSEGWTKFLNHSCSTDKAHYDTCKDERENRQCRVIRERFNERLKAQQGDDNDDTLPHQSGSLQFYSTFFEWGDPNADCIGLELINPHDRRTRAGKQPIYYECVRSGAKGVFTLLHVPTIETSADDARADWRIIAEAIRAMMLDYGFSAKKSSGYGEAEDAIEGKVITSAGGHSLSRISTLKEEVGNVER